VGGGKGWWTKQYGKEILGSFFL